LDQSKNEIENRLEQLRALDNNIDINIITQTPKIKNIKKYKNFQNLRVIGMGGSSLGSEAIYDFLRKKIKKNFTFVDDLDVSNKIKNDKKCLNYETRPQYCRVGEFSTSFKGYMKSGDKFLIDCCKQHISSNYGY